QCAGRVLAADILPPALPLFDNSSVDGFAVQARDLVDASAASPRTLSVVADIPAGSAPNITLAPGQAARIMTGAPIPKGADAVIMVEDTDFDHGASGLAAPEKVKAFKKIKSGENIRTRGMDVKRGRKVLFAGHKSLPQYTGVLAMLGVIKVAGIREPSVALPSSCAIIWPV